MRQKNIYTKNVLINLIMNNGEKNTSEKLIIKCGKDLLKNSKKKQKDILKLFIINATPIFKLHTSSNKKGKKVKRKIKITPFFILKHQNRISFGIKLIIKNLKKNNNSYFFKSFSSEILIAAKDKSYLNDIKNETQKRALENKRYFKHFKA